jgi:hypothetical protein
MEEVTDPAEVSKARIRRSKFDRNFAWFRTHTAEVYEHHVGRFICIAGEEVVFAAATPDKAVAQATAVHPGDEGSFVQYIPLEKMARVYANQR